MAKNLLCAQIRNHSNPLLNTVYEKQANCQRLPRVFRTLAMIKTSRTWGNAL